LTGDERRPLSSQIAAALWNPSLVAVGQTAPLDGVEAAGHEANCDVVVKESG
jgi:hypothetical protein